MEPTTSELAAVNQPAAAVRVFVAVKIASEIARELAQMAREIEAFPVRLIAPQDIHLTLVPPWYEVSIPAAIARLHAAADKAAPFSLAFMRLRYGPEPRRPRFLWAECAAGEELAALRIALLQVFGQSDERPFRPHVTVARIRGNGVVVARKHPIDRTLSFSQRVKTVELMQSPPPSEIGYNVLASLTLKGAAAS